MSSGSTAISARRPGERRDPYAVSLVLGDAVPPSLKLRRTRRRLSRNNTGLWLWVPALAGTTLWVDTDPRSRGAMRPRVASSLTLLESRGRRESRVRAAPAVSRAKCNIEDAHEHTGSAEAIRPSLHGGLRLTSRSPRRPALLPPSSAEVSSANLTPASGCQDHTTSPSA